MHCMTGCGVTESLTSWAPSPHSQDILICRITTHTTSCEEQNLWTLLPSGNKLYGMKHITDAMAFVGLVAMLYSINMCIDKASLQAFSQRVRLRARELADNQRHTACRSASRARVGSDSSEENRHRHFLVRRRRPPTCFLSVVACSRLFSTREPRDMCVCVFWRGGHCRVVPPPPLTASGTCVCCVASLLSVWAAAAACESEKCGILPILLCGSHKVAERFSTSCRHATRAVSFEHKCRHTLTQVREGR